jgi:hypothetical protein
MKAGDLVKRKFNGKYEYAIIVQISSHKENNHRSPFALKVWTRLGHGCWDARKCELANESR